MKNETIILASSLFGSIYLFSNSMNVINKIYLEHYNIPPALYFIHGFILGSSGYMIIHCNIKIFFLI